ncbi:DUF3179 domain-containing protein [Thioalkalivibrio sp.]|uniref:DUF3179 domain-containing protein n=1 Tax=Thioalkalivibrio sp. TaxID=2093813 RepID=UPI0039753418
MKTAQGNLLSRQSGYPSSATIPAHAVAREGAHAPRGWLGLDRAVTALAVVLGLAGCTPMATGQVMNGFDLSKRDIPLDEIHRGGPPRDGIPALTDPEFVTAASAHGLQPDDRILGLQRNGVSKAYPLGIMNYHEVVNDIVAGEAIAVTYCPLCFTGVAFEARTEDGSRRLFGVSGLLYNSAVLLYDRGSESLWSQISATAVAGARIGEQLTLIPIANTTWDSWHREHPNTLVLSRNTDYARDYDRDPYADYAEDEALLFPVAFRMQGQHPKTPVVGVRIGDQARAYPFPAFPESGRHRLEDTLAGREITVLIDADAQTGQVFDAQGEEIPSIISYWFAWYAFHPQTERYTGEPAPEPDGPRQDARGPSRPAHTAMHLGGTGQVRP